MNNQELIESWRMFRREHGSISVDRMACDPHLRTEFLDTVIIRYREAQSNGNRRKENSLGADGASKAKRTLKSELSKSQK